MKYALWFAALAAVLSACGEARQTLGAGKLDAPAYSGTDKPFVDSGWKPGDKVSWESHLKARAQNNQNEYARTN